MKSTPLGYLFAFIAYTTFSMQDAISKHLGDSYSPFVVAFFRYWAFIAFALYLARRAPGGIRQTVRTRRPVLQVMRGVLLATQITVSISAFHYVGLAQSQAVFAAGPILVALLSVPLLGEKVGWRRWTAILVGLVGVLIILSPRADGFNVYVVLPLGCALAGAFYAILTRLVSRDDPPVTSFFYMCLVGFVGFNLAAPFTLEPIAMKDWGWMGALCCTGIIGHLSLIRAYDNASAVMLQPITYWQLVFATSLAVMIFGESLKMNMIVGAVIVVGAGLFTVWREQVVARRERRRGGVAATPSVPH
ncbi:DMT family transporter [Rhizobium halophytocola]|uniref:Drug/metabolite transporter (DMT)-like permease n=1 Tax=Rhizobium halophytocola TaxID=735519 RepID=A0ABS4DTJ5_9HYPH|nr:DMT family transporter [Rhizobium halophytocola]MBP1849028.1 drug/metabolite transporter (DMT)-like permease [Rhizobium halophytocola]